MSGAGALALAVALLLSGCAASRSISNSATTSTVDSLDVVVLIEKHEIESAVDTLVTTIADGAVRVSHRGGDAILDATHDRFLLLDPATRTYRYASLNDWEGRVRDAAIEARAAADSAAGATPGSGGASKLRFESAGAGGDVAGFATRRYHLFAERPLFPGEWEQIEQEIWVTPAIELVPGAAAAYRRMFETLDWIDFDARVERPPGVRVRVVQRRRGRGGAAAQMPVEVETTEILRVERRRVSRATFEPPASWTREPLSPR